MRSRRARSASSTRYAMLAANLVEHFLCGTRATARDGFEALPDCLIYVGASRYIQKPLIRLRILYDCRRLAFNGEHYRPFTLFELLHELPRVAPERRHRLDVFCDVEHGLLN